MYPLPVLEAGSLKAGCWQGSSETLLSKSVSDSLGQTLCLLASDGSPQSCWQFQSLPPASSTAVFPVCPSFPFVQTPVILDQGLGSWPHLDFVTLAKTLFPKKGRIHRAWGLELQHDFL